MKFIYLFGDEKGKPYFDMAFDSPLTACRVLKTQFVKRNRGMCQKSGFWDKLYNLSLIRVQVNYKFKITECEKQISKRYHVFNLDKMSYDLFPDKFVCLGNLWEDFFGNGNLKPDSTYFKGYIFYLMDLAVSLIYYLDVSEEAKKLLDMVLKCIKDSTQGYKYNEILAQLEYFALNSLSKMYLEKFLCNPEVTIPTEYITQLLISAYRPHFIAHLEPSTFRKLYDNYWKDAISNCKYTKLLISGIFKYTPTLNPVTVSEKDFPEYIYVVQDSRGRASLHGPYDEMPKDFVAFEDIPRLCIWLSSTQAVDPAKVLKYRLKDVGIIPEYDYENNDITFEEYEDSYEPCEVYNFWSKEFLSELLKANPLGTLRFFAMTLLEKYPKYIEELSSFLDTLKFEHQMFLNAMLHYQELYIPVNPRNYKVLQRNKLIDYCYKKEKWDLSNYAGVCLNAPAKKDMVLVSEGLQKFGYTVPADMIIRNTIIHRYDNSLIVHLCVDEDPGFIRAFNTVLNTLSKANKFSSDLVNSLFSFKNNKGMKTIDNNLYIKYVVSYDGFEADGSKIMK